MTPPEIQRPAAPPRPIQSRANAGKPVLLTLFLVMWLSVMALAIRMSMAVWFYLSRAGWTRTPWRITLSILAAILALNVGYLAGLLIWRIIIPRPREGFFRFRPDGRPRREHLVFMLNVLVTKLRYGAPWSAPVLATLCRIPPFAGIYRRLFCPHFHAMTLGDTFQLLDPYLTHVHATAQIGFGCTLTCHVFDTRGLFLKRIRVDAHAVVGGMAVLTPGVHVGEHAVVEGATVVYPNTRIPPYEQWGGVPARKIRDLPRADPTSSNAAADHG